MIDLKLAFAMGRGWAFFAAFFAGVFAGLVWTSTAAAIPLENCVLEEIPVSVSRSSPKKCPAKDGCVGVLFCHGMDAHPIDPDDPEAGVMSKVCSFAISTKKGFRLDAPLSCDPEGPIFIHHHDPDHPDIHLDITVNVEVEVIVTGVPNPTFCFPPGLTYGMVGCPAFPPGQGKR